MYHSSRLRAMQGFEKVPTYTYTVLVNVAQVLHICMFACAMHDYEYTYTYIAINAHAFHKTNILAFLMKTMSNATKGFADALKSLRTCI
jgi:hypothetical protein